MKIELLYILDCPWCLKTKKLIKEALVELGVKAQVKETLINNEKKAKQYQFLGSPTVKINGKDIQEKVSKEQCLSCEELAVSSKDTNKFVEQECQCGCRIYFYQGQQYPYPPKKMIKEAIKSFGGI